MNIISRGRYKFIQYEIENAKAIFISADGADFSLKNPEHVEAFNDIKEIFNLADIAYSMQIHSDVVHIYDGKVKEGDATITDKLNTAVGVFTADCVPILMYDGANKICAAIHSGWRGTFHRITMKTIEKMSKVYGTKAEDIKVFIGPHIGKCCYEVGEELIDKFSKEEIYKEYNIISESKLSLEECIIAQCEKSGIIKENIKSVNLCTFCSKQLKMHSYRRDKNNSGRLFSFIYKY